MLIIYLVAFSVNLINEVSKVIAFSIFPSLLVPWNASIIWINCTLYIIVISDIIQLLSESFPPS
jgi:hypothetical protein